MATENLEMDYSKYDFKDSTQMYVHLSKKGLSKEVIEEISKLKNEPQWMLDFRLRSYDVFMKKPMPNWGADLSTIDFNNIYYYAKASEKTEKSWDDVPPEVKRTFDKLGIPEAEKKFLAGVGAQYESEVVYHNLREDLAKKGVIFLDTDTALKEHPEIFKKYFGKVIPPEDNKFAALNSAVWSGGSFIYIPPGVKVDMPLQAYFRINAENIGQFERTLIIADEGSEVHYIEGCFTKGTEIQTKQGKKKIENVAVGDEVLTHQGKYREVYHTQVRPHTGKLYTVTYFGDTSTALKVTDEHPFLISRREKAEYKNVEWKTEWVRADKLNVGDYLAIPIDRTLDSRDERNFFVEVNRGRHHIIVPLKIKTDKDFFRLVGYYLSEGSLRGAKTGDNYLTFTFSKDEVSYVKDTVKLIEKYLGKTPLVQSEYKGGVSIVLCSTAAARFFKQQFGKGAANKHLPSWVIHESVEKQAELIKGMWRGDGSFMNKNYEYGAKRMFRINTISKVLAKQLRDILLRLGVFASINEHIRTGKRHNIYCLYVGGENMRIFSAIVGSTETIEIESGGMKLLSLVDSIQTTSSYEQIIGNYAFIPIKKITAVEVENMPVYNFSVREDESYVAEGVAVHNCTAPVYSSESLHSAVVELIAHKDAKLRYTTIQNWSSDVYNLVTKRAYAYEGATVEWIDGNIGSKITMKYPGIYLLGPRAHGETLSIAFAGKNQHQDTGAKMVHLAPNTTSRITSKSVSRLNGRTTYRGLLHVAKGATNVKASVRCDALLLDDTSKTDTYPYMEINQEDATVTHEATVGKIGDEQIFYLMTRGFSEEEALTLIVNGFMEPFTKELPMEYAVELNRLIKLEMDDSVG